MGLNSQKRAQKREQIKIMRQLFVKERAFYRTFFILAGTLILEQAVVLSVNLADNVMIGSYSEVSLAGVAAVNQIQFVVQQIAFAISNGLIVLSGQYWGRKQTKPIRQLSAIALKAGILFALVMFAAASLFPEALVRLFVKDEAIVAEGVRYLGIIRFTYLFFAVTTVLLGVMRSVETVRLALGVSCVSLVVNCCINYVLISGRFGAPELGVAGAAVGTLTARILEFVIVWVYVFGKDKKLGLRGRDIFSLDRVLGMDYLRTATPVILQGTLWGLANAIQTAILGHMSNNAIAAYSVSSTIFLLLKVAAAGACTAATILIGKQVGSGDRTHLRQYVTTLQALFVGTGVTLCIALNLIRVPLLSVYKVSPETYELASAFILIQSVVLLTMSYQMPVIVGIIRGGGDTRYAVILDLISIWGIVIPFSCLAAFVFHWPAVAVVICLNADQVFKCVPAAIYGNSYRWVRDLTRG